MTDQENQELAPAPNTGRRAEARATLSLAAPMVMTMVGVIVMETVDTLMIGRLGEVALASAALALQAFFLLLLFGMGVLGAVSSLASQALAIRDIRGVRRSARQGLWAGILMGAPFATLLFYMEPVFLALGQNPEVVAGAQDYLNWMGLALIFVFLSNPLRLTMASFGVTMPPLIFTWAAVPLNIFLNWVFMFGGLGFPEMGLAGAGVATMVVYAVLFLANVAYILCAPKFRELDLFARLWRPDWARFKKLMAIGVPAGLTMVMEHGLFAATALMMGWIGVTQLAAHQISTQIISILFMLPFGLAQAAQIRVGLGAGAQNLEAVRLRGWMIFNMVIFGMSLSAILFWTLGAELASLFISIDDPNRDELIKFGALFLAIAAVFQIVDGIQAAGGGVLRGLNDTIVPMAMAFVGYWLLGIPAAYIFAFEMDLGGAGIWYGMAVGLSFCAAGIILRFWYLTRIKERAFARIGI